LVDPDGREIWLIGLDGERIQYTQGMKYSGSDDFIGLTVDILNTMNESRNGNKLLTHLVNSDKIYDVQTNDQSSSKNANFSENDRENGGAGGQINLNVKSRLRDLSHELFHAYQSDKGQGGRNSVLREVEAYLFSYSIANITNDSELYSRDGLTGDNVRTYNRTVETLTTSQEFNAEALYSCVMGFKEFSKYGNNESYSRLPLINRKQSTNPQNSLIKDFFPLK